MSAASSQKTPRQARVDEAAPGRRLSLEGELTIYRASELKQTLLEAIAGAERVELDLSNVTELDTSGVQLLLLAKRVAHANGALLQLAEQSAAVRRVLELLELAAHFADAPAARHGELRA